jgi:hypothetical protein
VLRYNELDLGIPEDGMESKQQVRKPVFQNKGFQSFMEFKQCFLSKIKTRS